ncbi:hypothetical protein [Tychonema sp. LEGE 07203]|nr:hypothetical protein [Tychonema sp. LEGE 07203]
MVSTLPNLTDNDLTKLAASASELDLERLLPGVNLVPQTSK